MLSIIGIVAAVVTFGVFHLPVIQDVVNGLAGSIQGATTFAGEAQDFIRSFVNGLVQKAADATTLGLDKLFYGQGASGASFLQGLGLLALTALAAFAIGHTPLLEQFWTGSATQVAAFGQGPNPTTITLTGDLIKPVIEGAAAYGIGDLLGVNDPEALGLGTAVGSFAAPWITAEVGGLYGGQPAYGSLALNVSAQIDGLIGGLSSYAYDGNFSLGQFGATQVLQFNDAILVSKHKNAQGAYDVDLVGDGQNVVVVGTAPTYDDPLHLHHLQQGLHGIPFQHGGRRLCRGPASAQFPGPTRGAFERRAQLPAGPRRRSAMGGDGPRARGVGRCGLDGGGSGSRQEQPYGGPKRGEHLNPLPLKYAPQ